MIELQHQYSENIHNKKVLIFGPYPPPLGGISNHIKRVISVLKKQNNKVHTFNTEQSLVWLPFTIIHMLFLCLFFCPDIVIYQTSYYQYSSYQLWLLSSLKKLLHYKLLLVEHNFRHLMCRNNRWKHLYNFVLKQVDTLVMIGDITHKKYIEHNIILPKNISIESAFLPPQLDEETTILQTYPNNLFKFITLHSPVLLFNAFQFTVLDGNKDLYGFDMALSLVKEIKKNYPTIGLIMVFVQVGNNKYYQTIMQNIQDDNLVKDVFMLTGEKELWPLFKQVDMFIRPTRSDSFSISVAESIYFNIPVVASDICHRQKGAVLFKAGNFTDLYQKVTRILQVVESSKHYNKPLTKNM